MKINYKEIHIGKMIKQAVEECNIDEFRICKFMQCSYSDLAEVYSKPSIDTNILLKWSKFLGYDFFRVYNQHLILFSPQDNMNKNKLSNKKNTLPTFRKNIYTLELIEFIMELINTGEKTKIQIVEEYGIPKTTLYKWIQKYNK